LETRAGVGDRAGRGRGGRMTSPWVMLLLLVCFGLALSAVLSAYRDEEPAAIVRGTLRRTAMFCAAVLGIAAVAYAVSATILLPSA